jgi:hypothetical protein
VTAQARQPEAGDGRRAYAALSAVVPRLTALIRSIKRPERPALGEWNAGDVAVHLAHAWETLPALAAGDLGSPLQHVDELSDLTTSMVRSETRPDLAGVADRIDAAAAAFLTAATVRSSDATTPWLVEGIQASTPTFACRARAHRLHVSNAGQARRASDGQSGKSGWRASLLRDPHQAVWQSLPQLRRWRFDDRTGRSRENRLPRVG